MKIEILITSEELKSARVSQAYFGRLVGITKMRVSQLVKAGLLTADAEGILLLDSLKNFFMYQSQKGCDSVEKFVVRQTIKMPKSRSA